MIGLLKAIDYFDLSYDVRFSTYAVPMIAGEIRRFMRDNGAIKVSRSIKDNRAAVNCIAGGQFRAGGGVAAADNL